MIGTYDFSDIRESVGDDFPPINDCQYGKDNIFAKSLVWYK